MKHLILGLILANSIVYSIIFYLLFDRNYVVFFDIGQGNSVLIKDQKNVFLYDTGKYPQKLFSQLDKKLNFFNRKIDILFISHPDKDHYFSAFEILKRYQIRLVALSPIDSNDTLYQDLIQMIKKKNIPIIILKRGDEIKTNNFQIMVLNPSRVYFQKLKDNDFSLVLKIVGKNSYLLTGDIEKSAIESLIECCQNFLQANIFLVPHHGSKSSLDEKFYSLIHPQVSVIQVGNNYYGHPHQEVVESLKKFSKIWRTDKDGELIMNEK